MTHSISDNSMFLAIGYMASISLISFFTFAWDKYCAQNGMRRIREQTLLLLAGIGGSIAMMAGQRILRHKTRKQPFGAYLKATVALQAVLAIALVFLLNPQIT